MLQHVKALVGSTCLAPKAWFVFASNSHQLDIKDGDTTSTSDFLQNLASAASWIAATSCHARVVVLGLLPVARLPGTQAFTGQPQPETINEGLAHLSGQSGAGWELVDCGAPFKVMICSLPKGQAVHYHYRQAFLHALFALICGVAAVALRRTRRCSSKE